MCGIVGFAGVDRTLPFDLLLRMRDTLRHRGPDADGAWRSSDGRVALGHRRLAIIDLSPAGRQPMTDRSGRLQIVFNGEIYNYQEVRAELEKRGRTFRTASDTEVILEAYLEWDVNCLEHLNGMFALALYDTLTERLLLARDRAGEKPLFVREHNRTLAFASELKALFADPSCPRVLDPEALDFFLAFGYVPGTRSLIKGIRKLAPGHAMTFDLRSGATRTWPYWTLPRPSAETTSRPESEEDLLGELDRLLSDSVRLRLIADVPVGIMLSGGIDSSLIAAMATRVSSRRIKTFTISFPGHGVFDESPYARLVADYLGTEHVELAADPATVDLMEDLARQYDEPIADASMVPTFLVSRLIRREATVALGGDGGDELFGGYFQHTWVQQQARIADWIPSPVRRAVNSLVSAAAPIGMKGRNYLLALTAPRPYNLAQFNVFFDCAARARLIAPFARLSCAPPVPEAYKVALCSGRHTLLQQATALDFSTYLPDDILVKVDRASMLCSLEVRAPFLDHRLIELAFARVPDHLRATASSRKVLLRRLGQRLLPPTLDLTRKQGFAPPMQQWFRGNWGTFAENVLMSAQPGLFDRRVVEQLFAGQRRGFSNAHRLFALTMIELWRREYRIDLVERVREEGPVLEHVS
jgi:asparagine synthase (glutamine-hydrolysing)